jgi:hypothetical protein
MGIIQNYIRRQGSPPRQTLPLIIDSGVAFYKDDMSPFLQSFLNTLSESVPGGRATMKQNNEQK